MATLFGIGRKAKDEAQRKFYQVGTAGAAFIPGPLGSAARSRVREEHQQFVDNGPGGSGRLARVARSGVTWASAPETNAQAVFTLAGLGVTAGVSTKAVAVGVRRGDDIVAGAGAIARFFGRGAAKQSDEAVTFASRGIDDVTARRGIAATRSARVPTPTVPVAGVRQQVLTPGARSLLITTGAVGGGIYAFGPQVADRFRATSEGVSAGAFAPLTALSETLPNLIAGIGAGTGAGAGLGAANTLTGVGQGLRAIAGPALLLGGAAVLAMVILNQPRGRRS